MATVKLQNGKVILKNDKVSCSCCDTECCMYPAQALADGLYTADDLPDAVILNYDLVEDFELTRSGSEFIGGIYKIALGTLPNSTETQWLLYINNERDNNDPCLITGDGGLTPRDNIVEDQFADTYTFAAAGMSPPSVVVTRRSLCRWDFFEEDPEGGGRYWILEYANDRRPDALWFFTIPSTFPGYKIGLQNSPVGTYTGIGGTWTGTIS